MPNAPFPNGRPNSKSSTLKSRSSLKENQMNDVEFRFDFLLERHSTNLVRHRRFEMRLMNKFLENVTRHWRCSNFFVRQRIQPIW